MRLKSISMNAAVLCGLSLVASAAMAKPEGSDAFNRPKLGSGWVNVAGKLSITGSELTGATGSLGLFKGTSTATAASAVISLTSTDLEYGAIALGNISAGNNAFIKIQATDGTGTYNYAAFYTGNNGGGDYFALASAVPSPAVIDAFFCGTVAYLRITSATGVQLYDYDYGTTYGAGAGLGTYGSIAIDNFVGFPSACTDAMHSRHAIDMPRAVDKSLGR